MEWELESTIKTDCAECGGVGHTRDPVDNQFEKCQVCKGKGRVTKSKFIQKQLKENLDAQDG